MQQQLAPMADAENRAKPVNYKSQAGGQRRALGDIGNIGNSQNQLGQPVKEGGAARPGVLTRRAAAQLAEVTGSSNTNERTDSWGPRPRQSLRPRDGNVSVVSAAQPVQQTQASVPSRHRSSRSAISSVADIDIPDKANPLAAADFINHMMAFYKRTEPIVRVAHDYMSRQVDINDKMRAILVDWLVDVHLKFKLMPETLYLTVNLIDRFLEVKQVTRKHLQLVGVTAMLVASKYEEIWAPEVRDFVYISDRAYSREQILNMEKIMLNVLRFNLTVPTLFHFFNRFLKAAGVMENQEPGVMENQELVAYATYLLELSLPDYKMLRFSYSIIAASAVYLACRTFEHSPIPRTFSKHTGYTAADLASCVSALENLVAQAPNASLKAVYRKFCSEKFYSVANRMMHDAEDMND